MRNMMTAQILSFWQFGGPGTPQVDEHSESVRTITRGLEKSSGRNMSWYE
jgi:hypothetical protein